MAVPDNNPAGVNINMSVSGVGTSSLSSAATIADLNFRFDGTAPSADPLSTTVGLNHSFIGDIAVKLTSPAGTTVTIMDRPGFPATAIGCGSHNLYNLTLDDDGGFPPVENQCSAGAAIPFPSGTFSPNNPLSAFNGQDPNGTWVVNVSDNEAGDVGSMRQFSLIFTSAAPTSATVDGRVLTSDGRGLRNATVSITNSQGAVQTATTSSFGFYSFGSVLTGGTYTLRVASRLFRFPPQTIQVSGNMTMPDFVGLE